MIGRDGPQIGAALANCDVPLLAAKDMEDAVDKASHLAQRGDVVLLSPACASFDMFRNYHHRGLEFKRVVGELQ